MCIRDRYKHSTNALHFGSDGNDSLTLDSSHNATFAGSVTATSFSGSGANLTNLPAAVPSYAGLLKHFCGC